MIVPPFCPKKKKSRKIPEKPCRATNLVCIIANFEAFVNVWEEDFSRKNWIKCTKTQKNRINVCAKSLFLKRRRPTFSKRHRRKMRFAGDFSKRAVKSRAFPLQKEPVCDTILRIKGGILPFSQLLRKEDL